MLFISMLITTITAYAKKFGDDYSVWGIQLGWIFVIVTVIIGFLVLCFALSGLLDKKIGGIIGIPILIFFCIGLIMVSVDVIEEAKITGVTWEVEINSASGSNVTYDDDAGTITCLCHVNSSSGTILDDTDGTYINPTINWTISPSASAGITKLDKGATSTVSVTNPDYQYTEDGTDYYLIAKSSGGKRDVNFTNDGISEYEEKSVTVQYGTTEYVELWIEWHDTGVATLEAGEQKSITADICGSTYTITIIVTGVIT